MNRFMSKHSSDHHLLFCHNLLSHLAIDASSCITLMPAYNRFKLHRRFDSTSTDESLRKICHYQQNVPQHYYLLDNECDGRSNP